MFSSEIISYHAVIVPIALSLKLNTDLVQKTHKLAIIFRETDAEVNFLDLHLKQIFFVEEKHNRSFCKEPVVADRVEQMKTLVHAVLKLK